MKRIYRDEWNGYDAEMWLKAGVEMDGELRLRYDAIIIYRDQEYAKGLLHEIGRLSGYIGGYAKLRKHAEMFKPIWKSFGLLEECDVFIDLQEKTKQLEILTDFTIDAIKRCFTCDAAAGYYDIAGVYYCEKHKHPFTTRTDLFMSRAADVLVGLGLERGTRK